jgi:H+/Cl- antiporter ClcA
MARLSNHAGSGWAMREKAAPTNVGRRQAGAIAVIFAAPIAVVVFAAVNLLYVRDVLGEKTELTRKLR